MARQVVELNQPPLEITLGGIWRGAFGATDFAERLLRHSSVSVRFLPLLAGLSVVFAGSRMAAPITIMAYGLSPIVYSTTAFIRPYAIPTFFALLFLCSTRWLLKSGPRIATVGLSAIAALGLVLAHALVPLVGSCAGSGDAARQAFHL